MKPTKLAPVRDREVYSKMMAQKLEFELYSVIFRPILEIFGISLRQVAPQRKNSKERRNAREGLAEAILAGTVAFSSGIFTGKFSAAISKELWSLGAKFNGRSKTWQINQSSLPMRVNLAISTVREKNSEKIEKALGHLQKIEKAGIPKLDLEELTDGILDDLHKQFDRTTAKTLEIPMAMSGYIEDKLKTEYTDNINLYIKGWADESVVRLRESIQENSVQGFRAEKMRQAIIDEYGVTANKAKFLARQETSLMVSKYRENNYKEAGVNFYMWSTSHDSRVRGSHRELNGEIFSWSDPPIVDPKRGRRAHPGEDFGCRCVAVPVLMSQMDRITEMAKQGIPFKGDLSHV